MGGSPTTPKIVTALNDKFVGKVVSKDRLAKVTGLTEGQVRDAMRRLADTEGVGVTVIQRGNIWKYDPEAVTTAKVVEELAATAPSADTLYEEVGRTKDGRIIVKGDVTGNLYKLEEL